MKPYIVLLALFIGACAPVPMTYERQRMEAKTDSNDDLCVVILVKPKFRKAAEDELQERGVQCDWPKAQAMAEIYLARQAAASASNAAIGLELLRQGSQQPTRPGVNCTTYQNGPYGNINCQ